MTACGSSRSVTTTAASPCSPDGHPAVAADEVDVVRPLHQELGHDRVVVVILRDVAVGALSSYRNGLVDTRFGRERGRCRGCRDGLGRASEVGRRGRCAARSC